jgi:membrane protein YqaA with SNARE-associated domain
MVRATHFVVQPAASWLRFHAVPYLALFAVVFGVNLLPAFGPPTWAILVFARLHWHLNPVALVAIGAVAASSGRYLLALGARHFSDRLPRRMRSNLAEANDALHRRRRGSLAIFAVFVVSPLPSAQLFLAAGLLDLNLQLFTLAFFVGRLVSYSLYVSLAVVADQRFGDVLRQIFGSPWSIALQLLLLGAVCLLPLVNWRSLLHRTSRRPTHR